MQRERKDTRTFSGEKGSPFEIDAKAINDQGEFEGYLSVFGNVDQGGDVVAPGAFAKSLQSRPAPKVKLLLQHDRYTPIGVWTSLVEDGRGLACKGQLLLTTGSGRDTYELMKAGALDGLSIGYRTLLDEIDRTSGVRTIKELDLLEGSVVTFPMNEQATVSVVKTAREFNTQDWRDIEAALRDEGLSRADAVKAVSGLKTWLQRDAGGPDSEPRDAVSPAAMAAVRAAFEDVAKRIRA